MTIVTRITVYTGIYTFPLDFPPAQAIIASEGP